MDGELSAETDLGSTSLRATLFAENTRDSLYSQTVFDAIANKNISRVVNVGRIATKAWNWQPMRRTWASKASTCSAALTFADSIIKENSGFVAARRHHRQMAAQHFRSGARRRWPATASTPHGRPHWRPATAAPSTEL